MREAEKRVLKEIEKQTPVDAGELFAIKRRVCRELKSSDIISNSQLLAAAPLGKRKQLEKILRVRRSRSLSGVSVIAIMTKPAGCPGKCIYCPGGVTSPKSYTGFEPAALRAAQNDFDPYRQVQARLKQLYTIGHNPEKCEVIVMGATFTAFPKQYREWFVKGVFDGCNGKIAKTLAASQKKNETTLHRVVGLTFETRPDWCSAEQIKEMLSYGATRIELGVQSLDDKILEKVKRGHGVRETVDATRRCKDSFLKVCYHFMPGLFSTPEKDVEMFSQLFSDSRFRPDMLKIYPCLVIPGTPLFEMWKRGEYSPYNAEQAAEVIARCKAFIQPYCRVMRVDRDIPTTLIAAGVEKSNLRELVARKCAELGIKCRCIRCREAGLNSRFKEIPNVNEAKMKRINYKASGGEEVFLSFEAGNLLYGFCRLRKPTAPFMEEIGQRVCGVRELHVYGDEVQIGKKRSAGNAQQHQHHGLGKILLGEAERISLEEFDAEKLLVTSGVGAREYYLKNGFTRRGAYMCKNLR